MRRTLTSKSTIENLKREAKRWLDALRAGDAAAHTRLEQAYPKAPADPGLRDIQHALAREHGLESWIALKAGIAAIAAKRASEDAGASRSESVRALLAAAAAGDVTRVTAILDAHPDIVGERGLLPGNTGMRSALHFAVGGNHVDVVRLLLDRGADPNVRDDGDDATPLHFAAEREHMEMIRLLVERGADTIGTGDYHELDVIGWATCFGSGRRDVVEYLLAHGARHTIFSAVATGDVAAIRERIAANRADLGRRMDRTNHRRRPLHLAVVKQQPASLAALLDLGADTEALDEAGLTALDQAAIGGYPEMAEVLLRRGAALRLPAAVALGRPADVERLLRDDPNALRPGHQWGRLIVRAAERAPGPVIDALIRGGASVDVRDDPTTAIDATSGYTALHAAAFNGNLDAARVLLAHGASAAAREEKYCATPAGWADYAGHPAVRDLILEGAIDLFDAIRFGLTARIPEILARDPGALKRRFDGYVKCEAEGGGWRPNPSDTPLVWATRLGNEDAVRVLRERGARPASGR
jgi:ankyrin repeat protein